MKIVDARGLSCPEPVILLSQAMNSRDAEYTLIVDNHASKENTIRYGEHHGYETSVSLENGEYTILFKRA